MSKAKTGKSVLSFDTGRALSAWWRGESAAAKAAFFSALIVGFVSHLFIFTGRYYGDHDLGRVALTQANHGSGRWLSNVITQLSQGYIIPLVSGLWVALFLSVSAFFACKILTVESKLNAVLIGALLVTFPSISNTNLFLYDTANYHFAAMLATIAVFVTMRYRRGFLVGGILLMCALAIYQAYLNVALVLCLLVLITRLLDEDFQAKKWRGIAFRFFLLGGSGALFYALSLVINDHVFDNELVGFRGMGFDNISEVFASISRLAGALWKTYYEFYIVMTGGLSGRTHYPVSGGLLAAYILLATLALVLLATVIVTRHIHRQLGRIIMLAMSVLLLPLACNFAALLETGQTELRMFYAGVYIFVFCLMLCEQAVRTYPIVRTACTLCIAFIIANFIIVNNIYYLQAWHFNQTTHSLTARLAARMEPLLARTDSRQMALFGVLPNEFLPLIPNEFTERAGWYGTPLNGDPGNYFLLGGSGYPEHDLERMLARLHGVDAVLLSNDADRVFLREEILATNMPVWPLEGSAAIIADVVVVNFGIADFITESEGDGIHLTARHYVGADSPDYEYRWYTWENDLLSIHSVTTDNTLYLDMATVGTSMGVEIINTVSGFCYSVPMRILP